MTSLPNLIADVHLGKLARLLRMLGFDTLYSNADSRQSLLAAAVAENRCLLSKNASLFATAGVKGVVITGNDSFEQLVQVLHYWHIQSASSFAPFTRCLVCNGGLLAVSREAVEKDLPLNTNLYYHQFWQCNSCRRLYWKGPHYDRMLRVMEKLSDRLEAGKTS